MTTQPIWLENSASLRQAQWSKRAVTEVARLIERLPRIFFSRGIQLLLDAVVCTVALVFAYLLRFEFTLPRREFHASAFWLIALPLVRPTSLILCGTYSRIWRYFNLDDAFAFTLVSTIPSLMLVLIRILSPTGSGYSPIPLSIIIIEFGAFVSMALSLRMLRRVTFSMSNATQQRYVRVLLIGSDNSLSHAAQRLRTCEDVFVVGMLVSEEALEGLRIGGFPVLGHISALNRVLSSSVIDLILVTDTTLPCIADIVQTSTEYGVEVKILPDTTHIIRGDVRVATLPKPEVALGRGKPTTVPHPLVVEAFRDRVVLITGAGGSIGSELSRQVAQLPVSSLILMDQDENSIFEIRNELANSSRVKLVPVVGDICDWGQLQRLFTKYSPKIVLHAAAYKHVPVMEENCSEAVRNNVVGTKEVVEAAIQFQAERFLLISTDKAVRPTSVMGATKRVAELAVQALAAKGCLTRSACVRFGNVLGSRGSVVPIFLRQIQSGGPVTITDENMTRYFMTIPDAVRLVLQASTLGSHGDIFMLDMGDPVKIINLAKRLIEASGLRPGTDIEIKWTGVRPGEKLHEQLWSEDATVRPTEFPEVFRVLAQAPPKVFEAHLDELIEAANARDDNAVLENLRRMPIEFRTVQLAKAAVA
jgi:FlaA1/EpsC-like NDP-sugar epimerase